MSNYLVVLVLDDPGNCSCIMDAWEQIGVTGVTILESSGLGRLRRSALRDDLPLMPSLRDVLSSKEVPHRTLFSVVDQQEKVDQMVKAVQDQIGDLNQPDTGFMFVVPVIQAYGLGNTISNQE